MCFIFFKDKWREKQFTSINVEKIYVGKKDCLISVAAHWLPGMGGKDSLLPFPADRGQGVAESVGRAES